MNSSPDAAPATETGHGGTAAIWGRRAPGTNAVAVAAALIGADIGELTDAISLSIAASQEAADLLDGMELRVRTLTTTVRTRPERCVNSVRGPVMWSETITARANALGNDDVYVCSMTSRSFDTVENRVLVAALETIARAGRALRGPLGERLDDADARRIAARAAEAQRWRIHHRLAEVRSRRLGGREVARLRGGHRTSRMAAVLAVRHRATEPFVAEDLVGLADGATRGYHDLVEAVRGRFDVVRRLPAHWTLSDGGLWCGPLSWRHPAAQSGMPAGLCFRGVPLLPAPEVVAGAEWSASLPTRGVRLRTDEDLDELSSRFGPAPRRGAAQSSSSSST